MRKSYLQVGIVLEGNRSRKMGDNWQIVFLACARNTGCDTTPTLRGRR